MEPSVHPARALWRSSAIISLMTLLSRLSGFVREMVLAAVIGAGPMANAFHVAFRISNVFRSFLAEGAFSASFVPILSRTAQADKDKAVHYANQVFTLLLGILIVLVGVAEFYMPTLVGGWAPGFEQGSAVFERTVLCSRVAFPYLICMSLGSLWAGVLASEHRFALAAVAPVFLNLFLIGFGWYFSDHPDVGVFLCLGIVISGLFQMGLLYYGCRRRHFTFQLVWPKLSPEVRLFLKNMLPGILGASLIQINLWCGTIIATFFGSAVSLMYYADRLVQLPLALIGTALGTALLPYLSQNREQARSAGIISATLVVILPLAALMYSMAYEMVALTLQHGKFSAADTAETTVILAIFSLALPAFVMNKVLTPFFNAHYNTKTPFQLALVGLTVNLSFNYVWFYTFHTYVGIAWATVASAWVNSLLLLGVAWYKGYIALDRQWCYDCLKLLILAATVMGGMWAWSSDPIEGIDLVYRFLAKGTVGVMTTVMLLALLNPYQSRVLIARVLGMTKTFVLKKVEWDAASNKEGSDC